MRCKITEKNGTIVSIWELVGQKFCLKILVFELYINYFTHKMSYKNYYFAQYFPIIQCAIKVLVDVSSLGLRVSV